MEGVNISRYLHLSLLFLYTHTSAPSVKDLSNSDFNLCILDKRRLEAPSLSVAYRYLNDDKTRSIPLCQTTTRELAKRYDSESRKRRKGKRESERVGQEEEGAEARASSRFYTPRGTKVAARVSFQRPRAARAFPRLNITGGCGGGRRRDREASRRSGAVGPRRRWGCPARKTTKVGNDSRIARKGINEVEETRHSTR